MPGIPPQQPGAGRCAPGPPGLFERRPESAGGTEIQGTDEMEGDAMADVDVTDASMAELVQRLSQQTATLVRQEMHLAQAELKQKGKRAGTGAGLLGAAGVIGLAALGALVAALILALGEVVDMWVSAFIVAGGLAVVGAIVASAGKAQVSEAVPPKPEAAIESVQADVAEIKEKARR